MGMIIFLIVGLLIGGVVIAFVLQNVTTVTVTFFSWHLQSSLALIIILAVVSGAVIVALWSLPGSIKKGFQISSLMKRNSKLEKELADNKTKIESTQSEVSLS